VTYQSPSLYHRDKKGRLRVWKTWTVDNVVCTASGLDGGKLTTHRYTAQPKNVGRANETTPEKQAEKEAAALFEHKLARKYSRTKEEAAEAVLDHLPMLAKDIKKGGKPRYPAMVQRKYNGFRCQSRKVDGQIVMTSKQGMPFALPHIAAEIAELPDGWTLDGEIYRHGWSLQKIASLIKRPREESLELRYVCYDVIDDHPEGGLKQFDRIALLDNTFTWNCQAPEPPDHCVKAETFMASDYEAAIKLQQLFIQDGYEGAILRNLDGMHQYAHRSKDLVKLKVWEDAEFQIADVVDKKLPGLAIFVCWKHGCEGQPVVLKGDNKNAFEVVKKGTHASREEDLKNREALLGRQLTVRYAELTDKGIPFHPVGLHVREEWD
jgi:ATP-dependent DNA ligase